MGKRSRKLGLSGAHDEARGTSCFHDGNVQQGESSHGDDGRQRASVGWIRRVSWNTSAASYFFSFFLFAVLLTDASALPPARLLRLGMETSTTRHWMT